MGLIVVSNRVPDGLREQRGGLVVALTPVLERSRGTWIGWSGQVGPARQPRTHTDAGVRVRLFDLTAAEKSGYYDHYANQTLWPLMHLRPGLFSYERAAAEAYAQVNDAFAEQVLAVASPGDVVWVHDYHLMLLAERLRARGFAGRIGFFLHVPLPPAEMLQMVPGHERLLSALLAYDHVGFQTEGDARRFTAYAATVLGAPREAAAASSGGRAPATVGVHPVSIDTAEVARLAEAAPRLADVASLRASAPRERLVIGVDRLDYSKGLPQRVRAFEGCLQAGADDLTLLQITPPSRESVESYRLLKDELDLLIGRINGQYGSAARAPIRYVNQSYAMAELAGFYRSARVGLVTPLRDGMNLVAKEYVAAQDPRDPGVLVLSRFAGAACELTSALLVNPYDVCEMTTAIQTALAMPLGERIERWRPMMDALRAHDVHRWAESFLERLARPLPPVDVRVA